MIKATNEINKQVVNFIKYICGDEVNVINTNFSRRTPFDNERIEFWFSGTTPVGDRTREVLEDSGTQITYRTKTRFRTELSIRVVSDVITALEQSSNIVAMLPNSIAISDLIPSISVQDSTIQHNQKKIENEGSVVSVNDISVMVVFEDYSDYTVDTFNKVEVTTVAVTKGGKEIDCGTSTISTGNTLVSVNKNKRRV